MKTTCNMVRDLLPLYFERVCSEDSRQIVEEHLGGCETCETMLKALQENTLDYRLKEERDDVIGHHVRADKRRFLVIGTSIASIAAIPIILSIIISAMAGSAWEWPFVVLAVLMVFASGMVAPLLAKSDESSLAVVGFGASVTLLLLTSAIYGFAGWFLILIIPIPFVMSKMLTPHIINRIPLTGAIKHHKELLATIINTLLLFAAVIIIKLFNKEADFSPPWPLIYMAAVVYLIAAWGWFLIIRRRKK